MSCARCGCGIYKTEEFISLNKIWHKCCFTCYQCSKRLDKDTAKIFQGELFCEICYTSVIEKLFEVISTPSVNRPTKVVSTPSCAISNNSFEQRLQNCENVLKNIDSAKNKEYCFPVEKKLNECAQRTVQSCSCIPNQNEPKDEYCFIFPIPREVANYYNRAHMKHKNCKDPTCNTQPQYPSCSCRNTCPIKCQVQVRTLKNQCCCNSSPLPRCSRNTSPQICCCSSSPKSPCSPAVFDKSCSCGLSQKPRCCNQCSSPLRKDLKSRCVSPRRSPPPCQRCSCCPNKSQSYKTKCPQSPCPLGKCCRPTQNYVLPPRCASPQRCGCSPPPCCPHKIEGCCCSTSNQSSLENSKTCKKSPNCCACQRAPKYCICGNMNPCNCKMALVKAQCTTCCIRCGQKVYAAEKILVSCGAYHTSCFTCFCCNKYLDVKNVYEGCGEIYCKQCYNHFFGVEYYGFGGRNC